MGRIGALGVGIAVLLVLAAPAGAALEVRLSTLPTTPVAGQKTRIVIRTYVPLIREDGSCCDLEPGGPRSYPYRVEVVSPAGRATRVVVRRVRPNLWRGVFRFPRAGTWRVQVSNFGPSYKHAPGARPRITVRVRLR